MIVEIQGGDSFGNLWLRALQWNVDVKKLAADPTEIDRKIEELQWTNTILFAVSGYRNLEGGKFNADFT